MGLKQGEINQVYEFFGKNPLIYNATHRLEKLRKAATASLELNPRCSVLDIGCGTGLNFPYLYRIVGEKGKIVGIDLSGNMLLCAKKRIQTNHWKNIKLVFGDAAKARFKPNTFDGAIATISLSCVPDHLQAVANAFFSLKKGGKISIADGKQFSFKPLNLLMPLLRWNKSWDSSKNIIGDIKQAYPNSPFTLKEFALGSQFILTLTKI
ncbi:class I SAM-dependent methyltransferase [Candidatus Woesearchaeota archaeon]|nr:class I SAM-dependent methyltransferase [Candidatus Woesearchaeota archaeon]